MSERYANRILRAIKEAESDEDILVIINAVYADGFSDGENGATL